MDPTIQAALIAIGSFIAGRLSYMKMWWNKKQPTEKKEAANAVITALEDGVVSPKEIKDFINKFG